MKRQCLAVLLFVAGAVSPAFAQYTFNTLVNFNYSNGQNPWSGGLTLMGSTLYGTTGLGGNGGGPYGYGTVFSVPITGGAPTTLVNFNASNGAYPESGLTLVGGTFYSTTGGGGANGDGTVFSLPSVAARSPLWPISMAAMGARSAAV